MKFFEFEQLAAALLQEDRGALPNLYIYGPPGTSKTYFLNELISKLKLPIMGYSFVPSTGTYESSRGRAAHWRELIGDREVRIWWLTFHQGISYEDFVLGLRPIPEGAGLKLQPRAGPLLEAAEWAKSGGASFIFIDEMNRGDLPRILGDFITFMEYGNRLKEDGRGDGILPLTFANLNRDDSTPRISEKIIFQSGEETIDLVDGGYKIPRHLYILGTMNSLDRSVAPIDSAIERRFNRINLKADPESLGDEGWPIPESLREIAIRLLKKLNGIIDKKPGIHYPQESHLGQAYLGTSKTMAAFKYAVTYRLEPQFKKIMGRNQEIYIDTLREISEFKEFRIDVESGQRLP